MLNSSSPEARRSYSRLLTEDPFSFNIELDEDCVAQSADILYAYLKTLGLKLSFHKIRKFKLHPAMVSVVTTVGKKYQNVIFEVPEDIKSKYKDNTNEDGSHNITQQERDDISQFVRDQIKKETQRLNREYKPVIEQVVGFKEKNDEYKRYKEKLKEIGINK